MKNLFNKDYFENGIGSGLSLYTNYRWIPELTIPMAFRIIEEMQILPKENVLDFGCAKGYLTYAMRLLYRTCYGVDISEYAISDAEAKVKDYLQLITKPSDLSSLHFNRSSGIPVSEFSHVIAKDVFEHIEPETLRSVLKELRKITRKMFVVVPLGDGFKYYEPAYENDVTHIIREDVGWWKPLFISNGFRIVRWSYKLNGIKENWKSERANAIFILD